MSLGDILGEYTLCKRNIQDKNDFLFNLLVRYHVLPHQSFYLFHNLLPLNLIVNKNDKLPKNLGKKSLIMLTDLKNLTAMTITIVIAVFKNKKLK